MIATSGMRVVSPVALTSSRVPTIGGICGCATCAAATEGSAATPSASPIIKFLIHSS